MLHDLQAQCFYIQLEETRSKYYLAKYSSEIGSFFFVVVLRSQLFNGIEVSANIGLILINAVNEIGIGFLIKVSSSFVNIWISLA